MEITWLTAFVDRATDSSEAAEQFWLAVTGSELSARRGDHDEFATLLPPDGDPYLRLQRIRSGPEGSHLDIHVDDVPAAAQEAVAAGAHPIGGTETVATMRSPAGVTFCLVRHRGERSFPEGRAIDGVPFVVDQLCLDVPAEDWIDERRFWEQLTGWPLARSAQHPELGWLAPTDHGRHRLLRLVLQRMNGGEGHAGCHLDIAADDPSVVASHLQMLGATTRVRRERWIVMEDPSGVAFCVTSRRAATGMSDDVAAWPTDADLIAARTRFVEALPGFEAPIAFTVARVDSERSFSFGHLNAPGGTHLLPAAVLSVVCEHSTGSASYVIGRAQFREAVRLLSPAEAAHHVDHPNLWSWRHILDESNEGSTFVVVFVHDFDDPPSSPADEEFRRQLLGRT